MPEDQYISGIGGWLLFLIIILMLLAPATGLGKLTNEFQDAEKKFPLLDVNTQWIHYKQVSWLIFAVTAAVGFVAGYRLWKIHAAESVRFAILALWVCGPLGNFLYLVATMLIFGSRASASAVPKMLGATMASCIAAGLWTAYLTRSFRVRNTYKSSFNTGVIK
jgi:uncharacterized protein DUF2569